MKVVINLGAKDCLRSGSQNVEHRSQQHARAAARRNRATWRVQTPAKRAEATVRAGLRLKPDTGEKAITYIVDEQANQQPA